MNRPLPHGLHWLACLLVCALMLLTTGAVNAQPAATPTPTTTAVADADAVLDGARKQIDAVQKSLKDGLTDAALLDLRNGALDAQTKAEAVAASLAPQLTGMQARVAELGTPAEGVKEAPDVAAQRTQLDKNVTALDAQVKLARLLSVEAEQAAGAILAQRRSQFQARLGERTRTILGPPFWTEVRNDFPRDGSRLSGVFRQLGSAFAKVPLAVWGGVVLFIAVLELVRWWVRRLLLRLTSTRVPPGRLRRSLHALSVVVVSMAMPGLIAQAVYTALTWDGTITDDSRTLVASVVGAVWFSGFVAGLGQALLQASKPSWRLPSIPDAVARRLRWFPRLFAVLIVLAWTIGRLSVLVNASLATTVATNCAVALALGLCMGVALLRYGRMRRAAVV
ncbi:MAG: mechanosensitive ion channel protein, partial [Rhizobacter sp.]|nr:mechanosensitive ion channel protein [Rhizobacter sp.]